MLARCWVIVVVVFVSCFLVVVVSDVVADVVVVSRHSCVPCRYIRPWSPGGATLVRMSSGWSGASNNSLVEFLHPSPVAEDHTGTGSPFVAIPSWEQAGSTTSSPLARSSKRLGTRTTSDRTISSQQSGDDGSVRSRKYSDASPRRRATPDEQEADAEGHGHVVTTGGAGAAECTGSRADNANPDAVAAAPAMRESESERSDKPGPDRPGTRNGKASKVRSPVAAAATAPVQRLQEGPGFA